MRSGPPPGLRGPPWGRSVGRGPKRDRPSDRYPVALNRPDNPVGRGLASAVRGQALRSGANQDRDSDMGNRADPLLDLRAVSAGRQVWRRGPGSLTVTEAGDGSDLGYSDLARWSHDDPGLPFSCGVARPARAHFA